MADERWVIRGWINGIPYFFGPRGHAVFFPDLAVQYVSREVALLAADMFQLTNAEVVVRG